MVGELREIREFLAQCQPFSLLPAGTLDALPRNFSVRYLRRGTLFPPADAPEDGLYLIRKGAIELRDDSGGLVAKIAEGDSYDVADSNAAVASMLSGTTIEDCLVYFLDGQLVSNLRESHAAFDASFERSVLARLRGAREAILVAPQVGGGLLRQTVNDLIAREPVMATPNLSVEEAAAMMTRERVSALLVVQGSELIGIVTDRDIRSRCVAVAVSSATAIREIMSPDPITISSDEPAFEALLKMTARRIHHLPVVDRRGIRGLVSTTDLLRSESTNTLQLADRIRRGESVEALSAASGQLRELHLQLVAAHATARQLGRAVTAVADAITQRLIELAVARLGPAPVPCAWIATGSQGRRELGIGSDQDNSLILDDAYEESSHGEYFESLARFVNEGLADCGYRLCPGDVMASNVRWRQPLRVWRSYLRDWVTQVDHNSATLAANFLDMRTIWGEDLLRDELVREALPLCAGNHVFLAYMAAHALNNRPPLGFFRRFVVARSGEHEGTVDLKRQGLIPIVDLARVHALQAGLTHVPTDRRLAELAGSPNLSEQGAESLRAAFEYIGTLRALHVAELLRRQETVDNRVAPGSLSDLERRHLRDAFMAISTAQDTLRSVYEGRLPL